MRLHLLVLLVFSMIGSCLAGDKPATNSYVTYSAKLEKATLKADAGGTILFTLKPTEGIHINTQPPPSFVIDSSNGIRQTGSLLLTTLEKSTFLDPAKPIRQQIRIPSSAKPGTLTLRGTLIYYYCSDAEGWCSRFKQPVELPVTVAP